MAKRRVTPEDLLRLEFVSDPVFSPDGKRILFTKKKVNEKNATVGHLFSVDVDSGELKRWTAGEKGCGAGRYSPNGERISFVSARSDAAQIYTLPADGGEAEALTHFEEGSIGGYEWSPDSKWIVASFRETHPDRTKAASKKREEEGRSTPAWKVDNLWYRLDGDGYFGPQRYQLYLIDASTGDHKLLVPADLMGSFSFDWLPDSSGLVVSHSANEELFTQPPNDQLYRVDLEGNKVQLPGLPQGDKGGVRVSPKGDLVAYVGDVDLQDPWGVRNTRLYVVPIEGGEPRVLAEEQDVCFSVGTLSDTSEASFGPTLRWLPDQSAILASIGVRGEVRVASVGLDGKFEYLSEGPRVLAMNDLSKDGSRVAATFQDPTHLAEVACFEVASRQTKVLTKVNQAWLDEVELSKPEEFSVESRDGTEVHGWFLPALGVAEGEKAPAILEIHGGPHAQYGWTFFFEFQLLAAQGYSVFYTNPRGSKGYGQSHTAAIRGNWGDKDWIDVQAVIEFMKAHPQVDSSRMGVMGGSYGGYMTNWVVGHTHDFRAAITDRCVSNWVSMAGNGDFPLNRDGYFGGYAYGDLDAIAKLWKQSPIAYFDQVKTPMLVIHSEGDLRCNVEQGEQVFSALKLQGIEARFVRYPSSTSHGLSRSGPADLRIDRLQEIVGWWEKQLA